MSITTESPRRAGQRVVRPVSRPARRRATPARRRYVHSAHRPVSQRLDVPTTLPDTCVDERPSDQPISWVGVLAGVVGTAVVVLALVGLANLRAASLEPSAAPTMSTVQESDSASEVAGQQLRVPSQTEE